MRRSLWLTVPLCLLLSGCGQLVTVDTAPIDLKPIDTPEQSLVYAADGSLIATLRLDNREKVKREDLPDVLVDAVIAAEDRRFLSHDGVDLRAIARAALANQRAGHIVEGGSTITQQLIKNRYFPKAEETLERKALEAHLARNLEKDKTKDEILVDYFNTVYLGAGAYGIQAAARTYFGIDVAELDLAQAALVVGLIRSPESASPYEHPERAAAVRASVLGAMVEVGSIDADLARELAASPLGVQPKPPPPLTRFPYFVEHVKRALISDERLGPDEASRVRQLLGGGLRIHTTIVPDLQRKAEAAAAAFWSGPDDPEVSLAVVRPSDGHIVATVGGRDFAVSQFDLATQAQRQPGSIFKTFALVAALRSGAHPDDLYDSGSGLLSLGGRDTWRVRSQTAGKLSLREATVRSSNGAFARLALELGGARIAGQAGAMGVTSEVGDNPAIVLGGLREGVNPLDMASAYATLATGGVHIPATPVAWIENADGDLLWEPHDDPQIPVDPESAWVATDTLRQVIERGTGRRARLDRPAAGKTGTVQDYTDAWFVGYTPQLSTAVWVGYPNQRRPLVGIHGVSRVEGGTWPARIWREFMMAAHEGEPILEFPYPEHLQVTLEIDPTSGGLATQWCPLTKEVTGLRGELPGYFCPLHTETSTALADPSPAPTPSPTPSTANPGASPSPTATAAPEESAATDPSPTDAPTPTPAASASAAAASASAVPRPSLGARRGRASQSRPRRRGHKFSGRNPLPARAPTLWSL
ncbi:MAG TPA: transglycosylase domain-containing protein [Egibacteraceae bacterium]|nr:transglycosylase domain-containing protein [Egibacteraceae bacterium]